VVVGSIVAPDWLGNKRELIGVLFDVLLCASQQEMILRT
jgi:hypothetical protein